MRELLEKKMTGIILGIKSGTKSATDAMPVLKMLKNNFPLIADDYEKKYIAALQLRPVKA